MAKDVKDQPRRRPPEGGRRPPRKGGNRPPNRSRKGSGERPGKPRRPRGPPTDAGKRTGGRRGPPRKDGGGDKDYKFDRFEIEVGSPMVTGAEREKAKEKKERVREVVKSAPGEVLISMDPKAEARFTHIEKDISKLDNKVIENVESLASIAGDLHEIKEGYARLDVVLKELEGTRDSYVKVDKTMRELAALYDLISAQINPFIDMEDEQGSGEVSRWDGIGDNVELIRQGSDDLIPPTLEGDGVDGKNEGAVGDRMQEKRTIPSRMQFQFESSVLGWVQFLVSKVRQEDIPNLLKYYREIGWINEEIEITTMNFLTGAKSEPNLDLTEGDIYISEDGTVIGQTDGWKLSIEDHSKSLEFVEEILKYYSPKL